MSALAFDTHRAVKVLCEAGAAEPPAEAFVETIGDALIGNVATKADIAEFEARVQAKIAEVRAEVANVQAEMKTDIGLVRAEIGDSAGRLYRRWWLMAAGIAGLTAALVKLLG